MSTFTDCLYSQIAKEPQPPVRKVPTWWSIMDKKSQEAYIKQHPKSRLSKHMKTEEVTTKVEQLNSDKRSDKPAKLPVWKRLAEEGLLMKKRAIEALKDNPLHRRKIRQKIADIVKDPASALPKDFDETMTDKGLRKALTEGAVKDIEDQLTKASAKKNPKRFRKAVLMTLAAVGVGVIGTGLLLTGTLPYAILTMHLLKQGKDAFEHFSKQLEEGATSLEAMGSAAKEWMSSSMGSTSALAAAVILQRKGSQNKEKQKVTRPDTKEKKDKEPQTAAKPKSKDSAPKVKVKTPKE